MGKKLSQEQREERQLKEILRAYQAKPPIYSAQTPGEEKNSQTPKPGAENLPEFNPRYLKRDLAKSLALTILALGAIAIFYLSS